jgi:hypothetical protein
MRIIVAASKKIAMIRWVKNIKDAGILSDST